MWGIEGCLVKIRSVQLRNLLPTDSGNQELPLDHDMNPNISPTSPVNVDEEYNKTLRTKSFVDMWSKVRQQLRPPIERSATSDNDDDSDDDDVAGGDSDDEEVTRRTVNLLEPSQEFLLSATAAEYSGDRRAQTLLVGYCNTTHQAWMACADILAAIEDARCHYHSIQLLLSMLADAPSTTSARRGFDDLTAQVKRDNPLSDAKLAGFYYVQSLYGLLNEQLTKARRRILRRLRFLSLAGKAAGIAVLGALGIAVAVVLVISAATVVGIGIAVSVAPSAMSTATGPGRAAVARWTRAARRGGYAERFAARVDAAARGAYIMEKDLDTVSTMLRRVQDEVEHERDLAQMVLRGGRREPQLARQAAREVEGGAAVVAELLDELEAHVNLCLITINRSRRMVAQLLVDPGGTTWHHTNC